ncbi:hypothetical protein [Massilia sp. X63]|uniref:hypothetical protein n=1 Tax=Massilia sp. X63 TaxID=3237285 RepID=UPI0034DD5E9B
MENTMALPCDQIEPGDDVFCPDCEQITTAGLIDMGCGETEFWGSVSNHVDLVTCCSRCGCENVELPWEEEVFELEQ